MSERQSKVVYDERGYIPPHCVHGTEDWTNHNTYCCRCGEERTPAPLKDISETHGQFLRGKVEEQPDTWGDACPSLYWHRTVGQAMINALRERQSPLRAASGAIIPTEEPT